MPEFTTIKQLEDYLNKQMRDVLQNEVAQVVKDVEQEKVISEVYDKYTPSTPDKQPWIYQRRGSNGGLADQSSMISKVTNLGRDNGVELTVENVTKGKDENFQIADLVEYGDGYNGKEYEYKTNRDNTAEQYLRARPFTEKTEETLAQTGEHISAFVVGMQSRGIDIVD